MGIETKYEYIYYTVINIHEFNPLTSEEWFNNGFTWEEAINYVEHQFKTSEDKGINNFRVETARYEHDIEHWRHRNIQHKEMPVFVQFHHNQPIKTTGEGSLFVIYQDDGVHYSGAEDDDVEDNYGSSDCPDGLYYGSLGGLVGAGGRL